MLGFGSWDENPTVDEEVPAEELLFAQYVGDGLTGKTSIDPRLELGEQDLIDDVAAVSQKLGLGPAEGSGQKEIGFT